MTIPPWGPSWLTDGGQADHGLFCLFLSCNRNKRSITVDISRRKGRRCCASWRRSATSWVENYKLGDLKRYGLDYQSPARVN